MKYLAVLGRQPEISLAELKSLFSNVEKLSSALAVFDSDKTPEMNRLGGTLKLAKKLEISPLEYLKSLPEGKITLGFSDYSKNASKKTATLEALKLKKILKRQNRSVRVLENKESALSTATSHHNQLAEKKNHVEILKHNKDYYVLIGVQNITAYKNRDRLRPARDAKVGMLPPKLAQILINLCGSLKPGSVILDPFCGTGVVLQEALLMGFTPYGTDLNERMVEYSKKNLEWLRTKVLTNEDACAIMDICVGDAIDFEWQKIDAVACETYLGPPMSTIPPEIKLKSAKQECRPIILGFLKNLAKQIKKDTPVAIAVPAWLRENGEYSRLNLLDDIENLGYNVVNKSGNGLLYHREGQIVARELIILRKN